MALAMRLARADTQSPKVSPAKIHEILWIRSYSQLTVCLRANTQFWRVREVHVRTYGTSCPSGSKAEMGARHA